MCLEPKKNLAKDFTSKGRGYTATKGEHFLSGKYLATTITAECKRHTPPQLEVFLHKPPASTDCLDHETLDLGLDGADLVGELTGIVGGDGHSDDGAADTAGTAKSHLGGNIDVGDVLVLAQKGEVENDGERGGAKAHVSMDMFVRIRLGERLTRQQERRARRYHGSGSWWSWKKKKISNHFFMERE